MSIRRLLLAWLLLGSLAFTVLTPALAQTEPIPPAPPPPGLAVHFLDAGAGDAAWAALPDGSNVLIDCGPPDQSKQLLLALQSAGVTTIDLLAPSRSTPDALGGCVDVVRYLQVRSVLWSFPTPSNSTPSNATVRRLDTELKAGGVPVETGVAGWTHDFGQVRLTLFNPAAIGDGSAATESQVLLLEYGASGVLFAGGIHEGGERVVRLASDPQAQPTLSGRSITVLRAADHGTDGTSHDDLLRALFPSGSAQAVVLSYSAARGAQQPDPTVRERLAGLVAPSRFFETARNGSITLYLQLDGSLSSSTDR